DGRSSRCYGRRCNRDRHEESTCAGSGPPWREVLPLRASLTTAVNSEREAAMSHIRLTALDASFLEVESATAHMHVGWASLFAPPEAGPTPSFAELRDHVAARLSRAPRYRQKLAEVPLGVSDPVWVDDPDFAIERHVQRAPRT